MKRYIIATLTVLLVFISVFLIGWIIEANSYRDIEYYLAKIDETKLVKDYQTFYTLDNIINLFIESLSKQDGEETYKMLSKSYKLNHKKEDFESKWKEFRTLITYQSTTPNEMGEYISRTEGLLNKLYKVKDNIYIGKLNNSYTNEEYNLLIELEPLEKVFYILDFKPSKVGDINEK